MSRTALAGALLAGLAGLSCSDDPNEPGAPVPASMIVVSGSDQNGVVNTELPLPLIVEVRDGSNNPLPGIVVNFVVVRGGGSVFAGAAETDNNGRAQDYWRLGTSTADSQRVEVRTVSGASGAKEVHGVFLATALPGSVASVAIDLDTARLNWIGDTMTLPAAARDAFGNVIPGAPIRFRFTGAVQTVAVDSISGVVTALLTGGGRLRANVGPIVDTARVLVTPVLANLEPAAETIQVNSLLLPVVPAVLAFDSGGVAMPPGELRWRALNANFVSVVDSVTGASIGLQVGSGRVEVRSVATGVRDTLRIRVRQVLDSVAISPPTSVVPLGDSIQLAALAFDSNAVAIPGTVFTWSSSDTTRVVVSAQGMAHGVGYGPAQISATTIGAVAGANVLVRNPDTLSMVIAGGNGQADVVARTLEAPLVAHVENQFDEPVADVPIVWWSTDGVSLSASETMSGEDGLSAVTATFDTVAGVKQAYATIGHDTLTFALIARPEAPAQLIRNSVQQQTDTVADAVVALPRVRVVDRYNNGVSNLRIIFQVRGGQATGTSQVTGPDGRALLSSWITDSIAGADTVIARIADTLAIDFPRIRYVVTTTPDSASYMRSLLIGPDTVRENSNAPLEVQLVDRFGNPLTTGDGSVTFHSSAFGSAVEQTANGDGTYGATFVPGGARGATWIYARLDGDSIWAGRFVISRSYRLQWLGTSEVFNDPANWGAPGGPPSANDTIHVPATGFDPVLPFAVSVERVELDDGAQIQIGSSDLTVTRDFIGGLISGGLVGATGRLVLAGTGVVQGFTRGILVTGPYATSEDVTLFGGTLTVRNGTLRSANNTIRVRP